MITVPVSASVYQTMVANIQQLQPNSDGSVCLAPMQVQQSHNITDDTNNNGKKMVTQSKQNQMKCYGALILNQPMNSANILNKLNINYNELMATVGNNNRDKVLCLVPKSEERGENYGMET